MLVWGVGEVLWDVFPDQERFGGAALNFCANLQRLGDRATLLSAVGTDARGRLALERMRSLGLSTEWVRQVEELPTGIATVSRTLDGEPAYAIPRPAAFDRLRNFAEVHAEVVAEVVAEADAKVSPDADAEVFAEAKAAGVDWLYFGTLLQTTPEIERFTTGLAQHLTSARGFYDMNLRTGHWNLELVQRLSHLASILKLNEVEAETLFDLTRTGPGHFSLDEFCASWASAYGIDVICVTLGAAGCLVYDRGAVSRVPGYPVTVCDTVGSGDAFAAAFLHGYDRGWQIAKIARFANALGAIVASRAGATPDWTTEEVFALAESAG